MTPATRQRLEAAVDHIGVRKRAGADAATIIAELIADHGAIYRATSPANTLRVAGVQASCTWSKHDGLLDAWSRRAALKLMEPEGGYGRDR